MKVLLTGAFGNVGRGVLSELKNKNHEITAFDIKSDDNLEMAKKYESEANIIWGDLRNYDDVKKVIQGKDIVLHTGAIIPPLADEKPDLAEEVNVEGTRNIVRAMEEDPRKSKLIFTSSISVYGDRRENPFITTNDSLNPPDEYAKQKLKGEKIIKDSDLKWSIFRLSMVVSADKLEMDPLMFEMPPETCLEIIHSKDVGLALANGIESDEIWGEVLNIAGGKDCRIIFRDYLHRMFDAFGLGGDFLPLEAFSRSDFHCGFMDTEKSQKLLNYQRHTLEDYFEEVEEKTRTKRFLSETFPLIARPLTKKRLLEKSPYIDEEEFSFL